MLIVKNWETPNMKQKKDTSARNLSLNISIPVFPRSLLCIEVLVHLLNGILSSAKQRGNNIPVL